MAPVVVVDQLWARRGGDGGLRPGAGGRQFFWPPRCQQVPSGPRPALTDVVQANPEPLNHLRLDVDGAGDGPERPEGRRDHLGIRLLGVGDDPRLDEREQPWSEVCWKPKFEEAAPASAGGPRRNCLGGVPPTAPSTRPAGGRRHWRTPPTGRCRTPGRPDRGRGGRRRWSGGYPSKSLVRPPPRGFGAS